AASMAMHAAPDPVVTVAADGVPGALAQSTGVVPADTSPANVVTPTPSSAWNQLTPWTQFHGYMRAGVGTSDGHSQ
ncbi:carbohydrate porin, partial [Escherichia coli]|uniref:hypothetical protein n=1 Tax=Escherichia coli TaxID=562 RepID=UPI0019C17400